MNDTSSSSESTSPAPVAAAQGGGPVATTSSAVASWMYYAVAVLLAGLLAAQWWYSQTQLRELRIELASRLQSGDTTNAEARVLARSAQESVRELQAKVNVLESRQTEAQSQQLALEQVYQELIKGHDDWILAEIEQVLSTASQQLQLAGNVQGALIALQNADNRLATSDKPQFIMIRRAIGNDIERLKALPTVDITGLALRLDSLIAQVDRMPLLSGEKPELPTTPPARQRSQEAGITEAAAVENAGVREWLSTLEEKWRSWSNEMWMEVRELVRIRDVDAPEALLLSPTQAYYVRENLKLRLMSARLGLLSRNESAFRSDLQAAQDAISRYFDTDATQTRAALTLLKQIRSSDLAIEMPTLAESLNAVRNHKVKQ
jgi:uroporphyrin-3 C-methyltransferase